MAVLRVVPAAVPLRAHGPEMVFSAHRARTAFRVSGRAFASAASASLVLALAPQARRLHTVRSRNSARAALHAVQTGDVCIQEFLSGNLGKVKTKKPALDEDAQILAVECRLNDGSQEITCTTATNKKYTFEVKCATGASQDEPVARVKATQGKQISHLTFKDWKLDSAKVCELDISLREAASLVRDIREEAEEEIAKLKEPDGEKGDDPRGRK